MNNETLKLELIKELKQLEKMILDKNNIYDIRKKILGYYDLIWQIKNDK